MRGDSIPTEIYDLPDGDIIEAPGFYRISLDRHHSQPCMTAATLESVQRGEIAPPEGQVSVTSGVLRKIGQTSPMEVWAFHRLNPKRIERKETAALRLGRVMAAYIEHGPEGIESLVRVLPGWRESVPVAEMIRLAKLGHEDGAKKPTRPTMDQVRKYVDGNPTPAAIASIEYWLEVEADPRAKVSEAEWEMITGMGAALAAAPDAAATMDGVPEITMAYQDSETGLWVLARPDTVSMSGIITDFKKMAPAGRPFDERMVSQRITDGGYDQQGALACEAFENLTGSWPEFGIIAQSDTPPYPIILQEIPEDELRIGQYLNRLHLKLFADCLETGIWPGPGETTSTYRRPEWQRERIFAAMQQEGITI